MDIVNITVNGEQLKLWVENYLVIGAQSKSTVFLDAYASLDDLIGFDDNNANVVEVNGLSTTTLVDSIKTFKLDAEGGMYVAVEEAFEFWTGEDAEVVFKEDAFVAVIMELDGSNICFIKHEEYIDLVTNLTNMNPKITYVKHDIDFDVESNFEENVEKLKRELMESLKTVVAQAFTGENLKRLVNEYGGHSKFQRKKRVRITQERLEGIAVALRYKQPLYKGVTLQGGAVLTEDVIYRTINKFLPEEKQASASTSTEELGGVVNEIITRLDTIRTFKLA